MGSAIASLMRTNTVLNDMLRTRRMVNEMLRYRDEIEGVARLRKQMAEVQRWRDVVSPALFAHSASRAFAESVERSRALSDAVFGSRQILESVGTMQNYPLANLIPAGPPRPDRQLAARTAENLIEEVNDFQASLDADTEVALILTGLAFAFHVTHISALDSNQLRFEGMDDAGNRVRQIQHVSQCSLHMVAVKKKGAVARRIGFSLPK